MTQRESEFDEREAELVLINGSDIEPESVSWLWRNGLQLSALNLIAGRSGTATVLADAGGAGFSYATAINKAGQSVGESYINLNTGRADAVLWSPTGTATVLQGAGGHSSWANAINNAGQSVGVSQTASGDYEAVLWSPKGTARDLDNILGSAWSNTQAVGINGYGDIIGLGDYQGQIQAFLLMHVSGASSDHYDAVISHDGSAALAAVHDHLRS